MCIINIHINKRHTLSKKEKLLKAMKNNPKDVRFEDLKKLLISYGYEAHNSGGSHWVFRKDGCQDEVVPYKKPVKAYYVIRALRSIGEYDEKK
jgi:predicted RNA binding protein YcfA (HicA-like mRNA interferase family)